MAGKFFSLVLNNFFNLYKLLLFYASFKFFLNFRIVMTSSSAGLYGNFGQANYSSAKLGLLGLSNTLAVEGAKYNIFSNTIVPIAASRLTEDILPPNLFEQLQPKYVAPLVTWLCHENNQENGSCFEVAGGFIGKYKLQRIHGKTFMPPDTMTPESVRDNWKIINESNKFTTPESIHGNLNYFYQLD